MHMDRAERQPKTACVRVPADWWRDPCAATPARPASCAGGEDIGPIAASLASRCSRPSPRKLTAIETGGGTIRVRGVGEFSQVFAIEYRVRVDLKSPAESCPGPAGSRPA